MQNIPKEYQEIIDPAVYSSLQQFRLIGSYKKTDGVKRIKTHIDKYTLNNKTYKYNGFRGFDGEYTQNIVLLFNSLICIYRNHELSSVYKYIKLNTKKLKTTKNFKPSIDKNNDLEAHIKLIDGLDVKRSTNYDSWLLFAFALKSLDKLTEDEKLYLFKYFSKKCLEKYDEKECEEFFLYKTGEPENITWGTPRFWLQEDNPELAKILFANNNRNITNNDKKYGFNVYENFY